MKTKFFRKNLTHAIQFLKDNKIVGINKKGYQNMKQLEIRQSLLARNDHISETETETEFMDLNASVLYYSVKILKNLDIAEVRQKIGQLEKLLKFLYPIKYIDPDCLDDDNDFTIVGYELHHSILILSKAAYLLKTIFEKIEFINSQEDEMSDYIESIKFFLNQKSIEEIEVNNEQ